ncbi:hypothetical protein RJD24_02065 [Bacillaceae bacterium IKA-2]|nr:hypothetical protein RJD24_02065 [Bacillaceae bacterium IKA-2]
MIKKAFMLVFVFMISACSPINPPEAGTENSPDGNRIAFGLLGPGPINYGVIRDDADEYRYDGFINHGTSFRTLDSHRHDLGDDEEIIREILSEEQGVQPGTIFIIGKDIWVTAKLDVEDQKERKQLQADLQKLLTKVMQKYDVHLRITD